MCRNSIRLSLVLALLLGSVAAGEILTGRVLEKETLKPLTDCVVCVTRLGVAQRDGNAYEIPVERRVRTDTRGRFEIDVPEDVPGADTVIVFTASDTHKNFIWPQVGFEGRIPSGADVLSPEVKPIVLGHWRKTLDFALEPASRARRTVMVPMRDGTHLATDLYLPTGEGSWPVILMRTPYNKEGFDSKGRMLTAFNLHGYAVAVQDMRGRFASEGKDLAFLDCGWGDNQDGYDTVEWLARQPWCDGRVGTMGGSALGITQNLMAGARPPHLAAQHIGVAAFSLYHHTAYPGGVFRKSQVEGWLKNHGFHPDNLALMREHRLYDDFWRQLDADTRADQITAPAVHVGGWFDTFCQGTIDAYLSRQRRGGPGARGNQKLIIGPWTHGGQSRREQGELVFPADASRPPAIAEMRRWFDYWLKGKPSGVNETPAVAFYVMGDVDDPDAPGNHWRTASDWPPAAESTRFYFHPEGLLSRESPGESEASRSFTFDPADPVPTRGGRNLNLPAGPMDQRPVEDRDDVLLFTTEPLTEPLEVTGRLKAVLWVRSSAPDTDFTVKLTDVYPDGRSMLIADGIRRCRFREGFEQEQLMTPGEVYRIEVDLWSTSILFNRGHRVRVVVSGSNYPRFDVNNNQADPEAPPVAATNTLYLDAEHPSHIVLPVPKQPLSEDAGKDTD